MTHVPFEEWLKYVKNEVKVEEREAFENHLYSCDQCLDHYFQAVSIHESSLPILSNEREFTDLVMKELPNLYSAKQEKTDRKKPFYQQALFHYFVAAVATLLLTLTGVFHSIAEYAGTVENPHFQEKHSSVSEGFIDKTFAWMDSLDMKNKGADKK